ncbi:hypothetical protein [Daejeonella sp.]|uniref:hypothetical protein n=1 Tax=Daejeonella sp. TaxID=2805397 RepID=UPI00271CDEA7|nr:hypothetical protein [Daejeonella sp.]MDO8991983.1 hypothetical protein [Daejeonella sp.]MDP2412814.1 hypothetical protein [Daejeonella sp.]
MTVTTCNSLIAVPKFKSIGNFVLKVNPWPNKQEFMRYTPDIYKAEILSSAVYYRDLVFIEFDKNLKIDGVNRLFTYYKGIGALKDKVYYELIAQWWNKNLLYTLQGQFSDPQLTKTQIDEFKEVIKTIKLTNSNRQ